LDHPTLIALIISKLAGFHWRQCWLLFFSNFYSRIHFIFTFVFKLVLLVLWMEGQYMFQVQAKQPLLFIICH